MDEFQWKVHPVDQRKYNTVEPHLTVTPFNTATLLMQTPHYSGHFILARTKAQSVIFLFQEPL